MGARQYHPGIGRFVEVDPIEGGGANDYGYPTDPINQSDLSGECWPGTSAGKATGYEFTLREGAKLTYWTDGSSLLGRESARALMRRKTPYKLRSKKVCLPLGVVLGAVRDAGLRSIACVAGGRVGAGLARAEAQAAGYASGGQYWALAGFAVGRSWRVRGRGPGRWHRLLHLRRGERLDARCRLHRRRGRET